MAGQVVKQVVKDGIRTQEMRDARSKNERKSKGKRTLWLGFVYEESEDARGRQRRRQTSQTMGRQCQGTANQRGLALGDRDT